LLTCTVKPSTVDVGAPKAGVRADARGVTASLALEAAPVPTLFVAVTVKVYDVPFVKPVTTQDSAPVVVQVAPSGEAVTV
jgi:hypothetical protein